MNEEGISSAVSYTHLLPAFLVNDVGMGDPFFCKYLCPQGVLEGAIPLSLANAGIRAALGKLFTWKFSILLSVIVLSVLFYRPFCKWLCPLGAFYALFNRVSLFQMKVDKNKCISLSLIHISHPQPDIAAVHPAGCAAKLRSPEL